MPKGLFPHRKAVGQSRKAPNRKALLEELAATLAIDVSEQPIERPAKGRKAFYSGKKRHTIKAQVVICLLTLTLLPVVVGKGRQHDFSVFKDSRLLLHPDALLLADSGYQGMHKYHQNSPLPVKKKSQSLSAIGIYTSFLYFKYNELCRCCAPAPAGCLHGCR